jgi:hypothetical protein
MALLEVFDDVKDKVVCDVDPNAGLLWWRHICYDVKTFFMIDEKVGLAECRPELDENAFCSKVQF